ncbi:hypothetical protein, partial [Roseisolibacter sp. H3M3-2]|uniref:hypothetical protein n=1 Tax=Roseisolibacter sp. H3M3-2 TaxID=3031323 RepID=UPI0023DC0B94
AAVALAAARGAWWALAGRAAAAAVAAAAAEGGLSPKDVAVLYFEDGSADRRLGALADGLTESLIGALGAVQGLTVVSRNGVAAFRDGAAPPDSVAAALRVGTLVQGRLEPAGDRLRVTVRLVDGASGADYRRASVAVPAAGALAARDSVVDQVARFLRARIGDEVRVREARGATRSDAAWALALQAERQLKTADERADSLFARAAALDPAWTGAA